MLQPGRPFSSNAQGGQQERQAEDEEVRRRRRQRRRENVRAQHGVLHPSFSQRFFICGEADDSSDMWVLLSSSFRHLVQKGPKQSKQTWWHMYFGPYISNLRSDLTSGCLEAIVASKPNLLCWSLIVGNSLSSYSSNN